jgi:hypothetical protein
MMATEKRPTKKQQADADKAEAVAELRKLLKPGDTVYAVLRHVSASGMSRRIDFYTIADNRHVFLSGYIRRALGYKFAPKGDGLVVSGCGMDMGFAVVYELSRTLFPDGFKVEGRGRNGDTSGWDKDGGYAIKSSWL